MRGMACDRRIWTTPNAQLRVPTLCLAALIPHRWFYTLWRGGLKPAKGGS
ncbi:hypothetical protein ROE7235_02133 [Roseibaca ekhonensis]|uniref:Uncharacterized protein n=1 Tax=Roseinatronobacter ekhonensis TaxID=254356 RepID=A0A3B0MMX3_9RHOB|nr:hypothetical protein ROE7235_02133 [Roseibaca ekhonensis]